MEVFSDTEKIKRDYGTNGNTGTNGNFIDVFLSRASCLAETGLSFIGVYFEVS